MLKSVDNKKFRILNIAVIAGLFFALGSLGVGCDDEDWKVSKAKFSENNLCLETARMLCNDVYTCCTQTQIEERFNYQIASKHSDCMRDVERACTRGWHPYLAALELGTAVFDTEATNACWNDRFRPLDTCVSYTDLETYEDPCEDFGGDLLALTGLVEVGGDCFAPIECEDGTYCDMTRNLCAPLPKEGEPCYWAGGGRRLCADGFHCENVGGWVCLPDLLAGEECSNLSQCAQGHYCNTDPEPPLATPVCALRKTDGEECNPDVYSECENTCLTGLCSDEITDGGVCELDSFCGIPSIPHVTDYCGEALGFLRYSDLDLN
jgi:hypothetical protein